MIWMCLFVKNSGLLSETWGTIGYHSQNVKAQRRSSYQYFGYIVAFFLFCVSLYGFTQFKDDPSRLGQFFNGIMQCVIGLLALMSPVPDTIDYGEKIRSCKVSGKPWETSRNVMEKFQDAVAAATAGDSGYLKDITGCTQNELKEILADVTAIPFDAGCFGNLCGKAEVLEEDDEEYGTSKRDPENSTSKN